MWVAIVEVPDRLSVLPSPQSTFIEVTLAPVDAELERFKVTAFPVVVEEGPVTVRVGGVALTVTLNVPELAW